MSQIEQGHYSVGAFSSETLHNSNIFRHEHRLNTLERISVCGIYDERWDLWWVKMPCRRVIANYDEGIQHPEGGSSVIYAASFLAHCERGQILFMLKNRWKSELNIPSLFKTEDPNDPRAKALLEKFESARKFKPTPSIPSALHFEEYELLLKPSTTLYKRALAT